MSKIYIASFDVLFQFKHLYLVYENDLGQQFVIRGGPENDPAQKSGTPKKRDTIQLIFHRVKGAA